MTKKLILLLPGVFSLWLAPSLLFGHAGNLDENGGHYWGQSYHCHLGGCENPTLSISGDAPGTVYSPITVPVKNSSTTMTGILN